MDVPDMKANALFAFGSEGETADNMFTPGAAISGCLVQKRRKKSELELLLYINLFLRILFTRVKKKILETRYDSDVIEQLKDTR